MVSAETNVNKNIFKIIKNIFFISNPFPKKINTSILILQHFAQYEIQYN